MSDLMINAQDLWGNLAGEDEDILVLEKYFVDKEGLFSLFRSPSIPLKIVRSRKGMGKSALLRKVAHEKRTKHPDSALVVEVSGADLAASLGQDLNEPDELIYRWKQVIAGVVMREIGSVIGFALTEDQIQAVEAAELEGLREGSMVSSLLKRLQLKLGISDGIQITPSGPRELSGDIRARISRLQKEGTDRVVWVFVDDIDATYIGTDKQRRKISTFFSACRALARSVPGLRIRASVRSDVWSDIQEADEALDKARQYVIDLVWKEDEVREILAERVRGYFLRHEIGLSSNLLERNYHGDRGILRKVFDDPWRTQEDESRGRKGRPPHAWIFELSYGRPRWAAHLCHLAAEAAVADGSEKIGWTAVNQVLEEFGRARVRDLVREHHHQCPEIDEVIQAFVDQPPEMTTSELSTAIHNRILTHFRPRIDGKKVTGARPVAQFLYRVGFLIAVFDGEDGTVSRDVFETRSSLLRARANPDEGCRWEIHACFRKHLNRHREI